MIELKNLTVRYPSITAVDDFSFRFDAGIIYGLVGPNGAGKSTMIRAMIGQIHQYSGEVLINGQLLNRNRTLAKSLIGYAPEDTNLYPYLTAREYLSFILDIRKQVGQEERIEQTLNLLGLSDVSGEIVMRYSHGMRKKLSLAAALIADPEYIIIDEALNGLDPLTLFNVKSYLTNVSRNGKTVLLSSHILELVERWCDIILVMHCGKIRGRFTRADIETKTAQTGKSFNELFIEMIRSDPDT